MNSPDKCTYCPRDAVYTRLHELIEQLRQFHMNSGEEVLDDSVASRIVDEINDSGFLDNPVSTSDLRESMLRGFDLIDMLENLIKHRQTEETKFCVGALRLRAKDSRTQYDVAICRSPKNNGLPFFENLEPAVVTKKTIT